jgi:hypothetical protein
MIVMSLLSALKMVILTNRLSGLKVTLEEIYNKYFTN